MDSLDFKVIEKSLKKFPVLEDPPDRRDFEMTNMLAAAPSEIPERFSLRENMTPAKNQGSRGTCTAFAMAAIMEYFDVLEWESNKIDLSEEFQFYNTKQFDKIDYNYTGYGAYLRSAVKACKNFGICKEGLAPYDPASQWQKFEPTIEQTSNAEKHKIRNYTSIKPTVEDIKRAIIVSGAPLLAGFKLYENYQEARYNIGIIPKPKGECIGNHAMAIVGWTNAAWIVKNSWGKDWGDKGYIYWPIKETQYLFSIWSFVDIVVNPAFKNEYKFNINYNNARPYARPSFKKAIDRRIASPATKPDTPLDNQHFFIFLDRLGLLG